MKTQLIISIKIFALFTILLGLIYPLFITAVAQLAYSKKANGSLIVQGNKVIGSKLIGQKFDSAAYFSSRPSATDYEALPSGASNLGPSSSKLKQQVAERKVRWEELNSQTASDDIPSEMLFTSASGLDPHISPKAALMQVDRIVRFRNFNNNQRERLQHLIAQLIEKPQFLVLGEYRINVLELNLNLNAIASGNNSDNLNLKQ